MAAWAGLSLVAGEVCAIGTPAGLRITAGGDRGSPSTYANPLSDPGDSVLLFVTAESGGQARPTSLTAAPVGAVYAWAIPAAARLSGRTDGTLGVGTPFTFEVHNRGNTPDWAALSVSSLLYGRGAGGWQADLTDLAGGSAVSTPLLAEDASWQFQLRLMPRHDGVSRFASGGSRCTFTVQIASATGASFTRYRGANGLLYGQIAADDVAAGGSIAHGAWLEVAGAPPGPPGIGHAAVDTNMITWSWTGAYDALGTLLARDSSRTIRLGPGQTTWLESTGLAVNAPYSARVAAYNLLGTGAWSNWHVVHTLARRPTVVASRDVGTDTITWFWNASGNPDGTEYGLEDTLGFVTNFTDTTFRRQGLAPDTLHSCRVLAYNHDQVASAWTTWFTTRTLTPPPPMPGAVALSSAGTRSLTWTWESTALTYAVEDSLALSSRFTGAQWALTGLQLNTDYSLRVRAYGKGGVSDWTPWVRAFTRAAPPRDLSAADSTPEGEVSLIWSGNGNPAATDYQAEILDTAQSRAWDASLTWRIAGLNPGSVYTFRAQARNGDGLTTDWVQFAWRMPKGLGIWGTVFKAATQEGLNGFVIEVWQGEQKIKEGSTGDGLEPGQYLVQELDRGTYRIRALALAADEWVASVFQDVEAGSQQVDFGLNLTCEVGEIEGSFEAPPLYLASYRRLAPAADGAAFIEAELWRRGKYLLRRPVENGRFHMGSLLPGTYDLKARVAGRVVAEGTVVVAEGRKAAVTLQWKYSGIVPDSVRAAPNPARGKVRFMWAVDYPRSESQIFIYNLQGRLVRSARSQEIANPLDNRWEWLWQTDNQSSQSVAPGIYIYHIIVQDTVTGKKVETGGKVGIIK